MAKNKINMELKVTFTQVVEVEVDDNLQELIEDFLCEQVDIVAKYRDPKKKKIAEFLSKQVDFSNAGDINVEIESYE